jgi:hypothetical protein
MLGQSVSLEDYANGCRTSQPGLTGLRQGVEPARLRIRHGYAFQYRTLKTADDACGPGSHAPGWVFQVAEFPVEVRGRQTRIDYLLQRSDRPTYLVVECKRANPKLKRWCFAKAPYVIRGFDTNRVFGEQVRFDKPSNRLLCNTFRESVFCDKYHLAFEMRVQGERGDEEGSKGRGDIEDAATQVSLGLNGLIESLRPFETEFKEGDVMTFFPVIITTATLFVSDVDLSTAGLDSGEVDSSTLNLKEAGWVIYQYPVSPGIKHSLPVSKRPPITSRARDLGRNLEDEFLRSIAIVNSLHFEEFLPWYGQEVCS